MIDFDDVVDFDVAVVNCSTDLFVGFFEEFDEGSI